MPTCALHITLILPSCSNDITTIRKEGRREGTAGWEGEREEKMREGGRKGEREGGREGGREEKDRGRGRDLVAIILDKTFYC